MKIGTVFFLLVFALTLLAFLVLLVRRILLKEDKDSTVSYLIAGIAVMIYGFVTKKIYALDAIRAFFVGTYLIGTLIWGTVFLIRKITRVT